jgi:hypothetical protein
MKNATCEAAVSSAGSMMLALAPAVRCAPINGPGQEPRRFMHRTEYFQALRIKRESAIFIEVSFNFVGI